MDRFEGVFVAIAILSVLAGFAWINWPDEPRPYRVGSVVCLPNGARGTVQNITAYRTTVLTTDNVNRMYTVEVIHGDIAECK